MTNEIIPVKAPPLGDPCSHTPQSGNVRTTLSNNIGHTDDRCKDEDADQIADDRKQVPVNIT